MIKLTADFSQKVRPMGKLNGVNNGPQHAYVDNTERFREMGVDYIRFHETHMTSAKAIEIPFVFPNFDADEYDEANYHFADTDAVIQSAVNIGAEVMYRFGMGTESTFPKLFCVCPADYEKWGRIVIQILKHYNDGWANGFHFGIKWCEIWNEADLKQYWPGPLSEYAKFYYTVAKMLKEYDPSLLICPSGFADGLYPHPGMDAPQEKIDAWNEVNEFFHGFLDTVQQENIPLDCFPWHCYVLDSKECLERIEMHQDLLRAHGMEGIEMINTEWGPISLKPTNTNLNSTNPNTWGVGWDISQIATQKSAICCLASMIVMQQNGTTKAGYYESEPRSAFCGLYEYDGTPMRHYYSMVAFRMLREGECEYKTEGQTDQVRICASFNGKKAYVCVTSEDEAHQVQLKLQNLGNASIRYYLFDENTMLKQVKKGTYTGQSLRLSLSAHSAWLLEFELT